jgi:hypothetical protein
LQRGPHDELYPDEHDEGYHSEADGSATGLKLVPVAGQDEESRNGRCKPGFEECRPVMAPRRSGIKTAASTWIDNLNSDSAWVPASEVSAG